MKETTGMTWAELVEAMKAEGYGWRTIFGAGDFHNAYAWMPGVIEHSLFSEEGDPVAALADLLTQCRARWPKPDPFAGLDLEGLYREADGRGWRIVRTDWFNAEDEFRAEVRSNPIMSSPGYGPTVVDAVRAAMRKAAER